MYVTRALASLLLNLFKLLIFPLVMLFKFALFVLNKILNLKNATGLQPSHEKSLYNNLLFSVSIMEPVKFNKIPKEHLQDYVIWALGQCLVTGVQVRQIDVLEPNTIAVEFVHKKQTIFVDINQVVSLKKSKFTEEEEITRHMIELALTLCPYSEYIEHK